MNKGKRNRIEGKKNQAKEMIKDTVTLLKAVHRENKATLPVVIVGAMLEAVTPFISIVFGARILDALVSGVDRQEIMNNVYWMVGLTFVLMLAAKGLAYVYRISALHMDGNATTSLAVKCLTMDFKQIETQEVMDRKQRADAGKRSHGGMFNYCLIVAKLFGGVFSLIYALTALSFLFIPVKAEGLSMMGCLLNSPLAALLLLLLTVLTTCLGFPLLKKANRMDYELFQVNAEANRKYDAYLELCDYRYGKEVRTYGLSSMFLTNGQSLLNQMWSRSEKALKRRETFKALAASTGIIGLLLAYAFVGLKAFAGLATVGQLTMYVGAITSLAGAIRLIVEMIGTLDLQRKYLKEYEDFLAIPSERYEGTLPVEKRLDGDYEIEFHNVSFTYPNQKNESLKNVSFCLKRGVKLAVVGPNGAGKTTFIKLLCRLYDPTEGEITLNGIDIKKYDYQEYLSLLSVVFQDFRLFSMELGQNVAASREYDAARVWECLIKAGVEERVLQMKDGLKTGLYQKEENGVEISGGEAQKIAIARALYKEAPVVILDEPTSALDPFSEYEIYKRFDELSDQRTSIYISHRMSSCRFCDEVLVFEQGRIVQYGTHSKLLMDREGLYYKMWQAQAQYYQN